MSPLNSAPQRGYGDWERVDNWDTGLLYQVNRAGAGGPDTSPILDVSRFAYLAGFDSVTVATVNVVMTWYADAAGAVPVGHRRFRLSPNMPNPAQYRLPNLGPFVSVGYSNPLATQFGHVAGLFGTNRFHPCEFIPLNAQFVTLAAKAIGAGVTDTIWADAYYEGPVRIWGFPGIAGQVFTLSTVDELGASQIVDQVRPAANTDFSLTTIAPPGAWNMTIQNTGAASTYYLSVTPSLTGSS